MAQFEAKCLLIASAGATATDPYSLTDEQLCAFAGFQLSSSSSGGGSVEEQEAIAEAQQECGLRGSYMFELTNEQVVGCSGSLTDLFTVQRYQEE
jgi:hypothetical protein